MLEEIKSELLKNPQALKEVLENFGYCHIKIRKNYVQFGRDKESSKKSIVIYLDNNQYLYVHDYPHNIQQDFFKYISNQCHVEFSDILKTIKSVLHISDFYSYFSKSNTVFGGFYSNIKTKRINKINIYDENLLTNYMSCGNLRFLKDKISLEAQRYFNIGYDVESQGIVIPIRDQFGQLMGVKVRCNWEVEDGEQKYFYTIPCSMSQTLYGYSQNYKHLVNNIVYIFEAEKSIMQCYSYGIRNCVALGSGSISKKQIKMILELNPQKVVFMHDSGFALENIMKNIEALISYSRFTELKVGYWDCSNKIYADKISPSDSGKIELIRIMNNEIKMIGDKIDEEI